MLRALGNFGSLRSRRSGIECGSPVADSSDEDLVKSSFGKLAGLGNELHPSPGLTIGLITKSFITASSLLISAHFTTMASVSLDKHHNVSVI
jgi:hypothetical protein